MANMDLILLERIEKLGQMGDIVSVKPGFARNFLLPQKKALRASAENKKAFEVQRVQIEADSLNRKQEAETVGAKLNGNSVILIRQAGDSGQLYGSVSPKDVAEAFGVDGFTLHKNQVILGKPIKALGLHDIKIILHPEVSVGVKVNVARSAQEAELQAKGVNVVDRLAEEERMEAEAARKEAEAARAEVMADAEENAE
jgi:large subunit ribosomal protein L9